MVIIIKYGMYEVIAQGMSNLARILVRLEPVAIKAAQAVARAKPHIPFAVLAYCPDGIRNQPIFNRIILENKPLLPKTVQRNGQY
tara:strand:+ start:32032 stop:32286 length:255 start_codon:yes stop_codon:yes gene_type:complete